MTPVSNLLTPAARYQTDLTAAALALDPDEIHRTLRDIATIGNRFHNTDGERRARDYVLDRLVEVGCARVTAHPFPYLAYQAHRAEMRLAHEPGSSFRCTGLQYSSSGSVTAPVVYIGPANSTARLDELEEHGLEVEGRIVMIDGLHAGAVTPWLADHGAAAIALISPSPDGYVGNFIAVSAPPPLQEPWHGRPGPLPGLTIERDDARSIVALATARPSLPFTLVHEAQYTNAKSWNVSGEIGAPSEKHVVLGSHYDSQAIGPCVWDNGSGVAGALEIIRVLARRDLDVGVRFVSFGAEETGMWGSAHYVGADKVDLDRAVAMVNIDGAGLALPTRHTLIVHDQIKNLAMRVAESCGWPLDDVLHSSDHPYVDSWNFARVGIPSAIYLEYPHLHPYYHTAGDTLEFLDPRRLAATAGVAGTLITTMGDDESE